MIIIWIIRFLALFSPYLLPFFSHILFAYINNIIQKSTPIAYNIQITKSAFSFPIMPQWPLVQIKSTPIYRFFNSHNNCHIFNIFVLLHLFKRFDHIGWRTDWESIIIATVPTWFSKHHFNVISIAIATTVHISVFNVFRKFKKHE